MLERPASRSGWSGGPPRGDAVSGAFAGLRLPIRHSQQSYEMTLSARFGGAIAHHTDLESAFTVQISS